MKYKTLGDVVNEALLEYSPPKGRKEKIMNSLEHFLAKHKAEVALGSALAMSALGYVALGGAGDYIVESFNTAGSIAIGLAATESLMGRFDRLPKVMEQIRIGYEKGLNKAGNVGRRYGLYTGFMVGVPVALIAAPWIAGKGLYRKIRGPETKEKIGRIFRYPKILALGITAALYSNTVLGLPERMGEIIELHKSIGNRVMAKNAYNVMVGTEALNAFAFLATWACVSLTTHIFRDFEHIGKKGWKRLFDTATLLPLRLIGYVDRDKHISLLKKKVEKTDSYSAKLELMNSYMKKSPYDGIDYFSQLKEEQEEKNQSLHLTGLKKWMLGTAYASLFTKKDKWAHFIAFVDEINEINPDAAKEIIRHARQRTPYKTVNDVDAHLLMTGLHEKYFKEPQPDEWKKIANAITVLADDGKKAKRFESSEGIIEEIRFSPLTKRKLLKKTYDSDFFERFLNQLYEEQVLESSSIRTEAPLAFEKGDGKSWMLVTREGQSNLREELMLNRGLKRTKDAFKAVVHQGLLAQKLLYEKLRNENSSFYADVSYENQAYALKIDSLDLETQLAHRAFTGDEKRGARWGYNEYLNGLSAKIGAFREENYSPIVTTLNHGDYFTTNLITDKTSDYARIDPRHIIADALHDMTYISLDPVFLGLSKEEKAEVVFDALKEMYGFDDKKKFMKSFDYLYGVHNGLGLAASQQAHGMIENAAMILKEATASFKGKPFAEDFLRYMENSKGKELLLAI